jgi:hypothetical protein
MNAYNDSTDGDFLDRREPFEKAAAMQLGLIVLAFSRLDLTLEKCLAAMGGEGDARVRARLLASLPFATKLDHLCANVAGMPEGERKQAFQQWIAQCDTMPILWNERVRARWLPDVRSGRLVNLVAAPGGGQELAAYAAKDLDQIIQAMGELQAGLSRLAGPVESASAA